MANAISPQIGTLRLQHGEKRASQIIEKTESSASGLPTRRRGQDDDNDENSESDPPIPIPDGGLQAWLTVIGSTAAITASFGIINSVGTFQSYLATHQLQAFSTRDVAWISAVNIFLCLFFGVQSGPLFDRHGPRWLLASASVTFVGGMVGMSFMGCSQPGNLCSTGAESGRTYAVLMVTWGVLCGVAAAIITTTGLAVVAHWFDARRGLATGIVYAGSSIGGVVFPLLLRKTLVTMGWDWSIRILALIALVLLVLANVLIKGRTKELNAGRTIRKTKVVDLSCFKDSRFLWVTIGISGE